MAVACVSLRCLSLPHPQTLEDTQSPRLSGNGYVEAESRDSVLAGDGVAGPAVVPVPEVQTHCPAPSPAVLAIF